VRASVATFVYNLRFPGQYYQAETGLNQNMQRDFDPQVGRYVESDPIGLRAGVNTYDYVLDAPISYSDHYGLEAVSYLMHHRPKPPPVPCGCEARLPDFAMFQLDVYVLSLTATYTRDGDIFIGKGASRQYLNPLGKGGSLSAGWLLKCGPTRDDINNFLTSWSASTGAYDGFGGSYSINASGSAIFLGVGAGTSTAGVSPGIINSYSGNLFGDSWQ
jgi:RHS repeat-associated protein